MIRCQLGGRGFTLKAFNVQLMRLVEYLIFAKFLTPIIMSDQDGKR